MNDGGSWLFSAMEYNNPLSNRKATKQGASLIGLRVRVGALLKALGIRLFDEAPYGAKAA